ncbi:hypothetical protein DN069_31170 [Streptacidiphilus pinicola]|uniref:Protein kinase domain-containing protein n=2 Tax=Streptacidiphilus pinicola TaxID=2219663 RepID=A0A2X0IDS1_9ACTN|nr:hypothetical protein DN069_31170 [Streptacidiphilus pinicola]
MGRVWRATDEVLGRHVAAKQVLLAPELTAEERVRLIRRTRVEAEAAARLRHPGIVTVHDVVDHAGAPWIVMELLPGPSLGALIARQGRLEWPQAAALGAQVADALAHAHSAGIVHRDLKPDNILLDGDRAVLTDFGIARILDSVATLTSSRTVIGTPQYMPPEQLNGLQVEASGDLWSLGATLYAVVEGQPPHTGANLMAVITSILTHPLPPPAHAGALTEILTELLVRDAPLRPAATEVARRLRELNLGARNGSSADLRTQPDVDSEAPTVSAPARQLTRQPRVSEGPSITAPPSGLTGRRGTVSRRVVLGGALGAAALAGGLTALLKLEGSPSRHRSAGSSGSATPSSSTTPARHIKYLTLTDQTAAVHAVAFSPDGKTVATGSTDSTARLCDVATGKTITAFVSQDGGVIAVAFSPDGKTLATGDDKTLSLFDVTTGQSIVTFTGHAGLVYSVAFSPDGKTLASGSGDNTARLWDTSTGKTITTLAGHANSVYSIAFSPDGRTLATGSADTTAKLWDTATGKTLRTLAGHTNGVTSVTFSPDGRTLATGANDDTARLWNTSTGQSTATLANSAGVVFAVAFSPDGNTLATGNEGNSATLRDVATGKVTITLSGQANEVYAVSFSPDGKTLATGSLDGTTRLWDLTSG